MRPGPACDEAMGASVSDPRLNSWEAYWERRRGSYVPELEAQAIINALDGLDIIGDLPSRTRCLDVGCGDGYITMSLARHFGWGVVGFDISRAALEAFRVRADSHEPSQLGKPSLVRSSVFDVPFADGVFDLVTSFGRSSAATYWPDAPREIARILKPGGVAIFDFLNHFSLYYVLGQPARFLSCVRRFSARNARGDTGPEVNKIYHLGLLGIRDFFSGFGLEMETWKFAVIYPPWVKSWRTAHRYEAGVPPPLRPVLGRSLVVKFRRR